MSTPTKNVANARSQHNEDHSPKLLLRPRDVATLLAISVRGVWRLASKGEIPPPVKIGNSTRWRSSDLDSFIAQRGETSGS